MYNTLSRFMKKSATGGGFLSVRKGEWTLICRTVLTPCSFLPLNTNGLYGRNEYYNTFR
jgi:hypothetical protein